MKKDFDFDDIGKRTPYRTPDGFFEDMHGACGSKATAEVTLETDCFCSCYDGGNISRILIRSVLASDK